MEINRLKRLERIKYHSIREADTSLEKKEVQKNVESYLSSLQMQNQINGYIAIYWPIKGEVDLRVLKEKYPLALPRCVANKKLEFCAWDETPLKKDLQGIPSPGNENTLNYKQISVMFLPCLSIDRNYTRLGYGGGYFDRLRNDKNWRKIPAIGILTSKCVSKDFLTKGKLDIPISGFITDKETLV